MKYCNVFRAGKHIADMLTGKSFYCDTSHLRNFMLSLGSFHGSLEQVYAAYPVAEDTANELRFVDPDYYLDFVKDFNDLINEYGNITYRQMLGLALKNRASLARAVPFGIYDCALVSEFFDKIQGENEYDCLVYREKIDIPEGSFLNGVIPFGSLEIAFGDLIRPITAALSDKNADDDIFEEDSEEKRDCIENCSVANRARTTRPVYKVGTEDCDRGPIKAGARVKLKVNNWGEMADVLTWFTCDGYYPLNSAHLWNAVQCCWTGTPGDVYFKDDILKKDETGDSVLDRVIMLHPDVKAILLDDPKKIKKSGTNENGDIWEEE